MVNNIRRFIPKAIKTDSWKLIEAKKVKIDQYIDDKKNVITTIDVNNGELIHTFDKLSKVSKALSVVEPTILEQRFTNGKFFVVNDKLADYRDNTYRGFIHKKESIEKLINIIGVSTNKSGDKILLKNIWNEKQIQIPTLKDGGVFKNALFYNWSPFNPNIEADFQIIRLICSNGMYGSTDIFNGKIPVVNRWEEHMQIAYEQIQNKILNIIKNRVSEMKHERVSVGDLFTINSHVNDRLNNKQISFDEHKRLRNILEIVSPVKHLSNFYDLTIFENKTIAHRVPGHLSTFDAWNIVTEVNTHTRSTQTSTELALNRLANSFFFDTEKRKQNMNFQNIDQPQTSAFSNAEAAFFGEMA